MEKTAKKKTAYRLPPCPWYDIEGTQSWLESMAEEGLTLSEEGFSDGLLRFDVGEKVRVRVRLDAAPQDTGLFSSGNEPDKEAVEIAEAAGWKYLRKYGQFYVYMTADENAPELNTDPAVQGMALDAVRKRERSSSFTLLFWLIVYPVLTLFGYPVMTMVAVLGVPIAALGLLVCILEISGTVKKLLHLRRLKKRLAEGEALDMRKNWRRGANRYRVVQLAGWILLIAWLVLLVRGWGEDISDAGKIPLQEYTGTIPCATMEDMGIPGSFELDETGYGGSEIKVWSSLLAPTAVQLRQYGSVTLMDGRKVEGVLYIEYYETASPWLARQLAREQQQYNKKHWKSRYAELALPELGVDYQAAYMNIHPTVILAEDHKVMSVGFLQWHEGDEMPVEEWAAFFAEELKK